MFQTGVPVHFPFFRTSNLRLPRDPFVQNPKVMTEGARRTIQSFSSSQQTYLLSSVRTVSFLNFPYGTLGESPPLARSLLSHTVKELVSRGLKSQSGGFTVVSTAIDCLSLGRPPSWRRGDPRLPGPHGSIHFLLFFGLFFSDTSQHVDNEQIVLKNLTHQPAQSRPFFEKQR